MFLNPRMHILVQRTGNLEKWPVYKDIVIYHQNEAVFIMVANDIMLQNMSFCSTQYSELNFSSSHPIVFSFSACVCVCVFPCAICALMHACGPIQTCVHTHAEICAYIMGLHYACICVCRTSTC